MLGGKSVPQPTLLVIAKSIVQGVNLLNIALFGR